MIFQKPNLRMRSSYDFVQASLRLSGLNGLALRFARESFFVTAVIGGSLMPVQAGELTGYVALEMRVFPTEAQFAGQDHTVDPSVVFEPEYYHVSEDDAHTFVFRPFVRLDGQDPERTHADVRDLSWLYQESDWEIKIGASSVFWGTVESNHLVDVINQTDMVEDSDDEDKLGQPMIQLATMQDWGTLRFFYLPYFRERTFAGVDGRLRGGLVVSDDAGYESSKEEWHPDIALRYTHVIGDWDIGLSHFHGTARDPRMIVRATDIQPFYDLIDQTGIDLQYTKESWLWKLEAISTEGHPSGRFYAASGGFEYTFYQMFDSNYDLGIIAEYHRDNRNTLAPATFFQDDFFAGARFTFNDISDTELLAGMVVDRENGEMFYTAEFAKRLTDNWKIEADARLNASIESNSNSAFIRDDDFIQLRLARYF